MGRSPEIKGLVISPLALKEVILCISSTETRGGCLAPSRSLPCALGKGLGWRGQFTNRAGSGGEHRGHGGAETVSSHKPPSLPAAAALWPSPPCPRAFCWALAAIFAPARVACSCCHKRHKPSGLKQNTFVLSPFRRPDVHDGSHLATINVSARLGV